ncbi:MAG TPA: hypothetical protein VFU47_09895, partial [Armatimonadota bacterium]|nr:hypothetical protein [Armatimonadota bacterium]
MQSTGRLLALLTLAALAMLPHAGQSAARRDRPLHPKVLLLIYDPVIEAEGGKRLHEVCRWNDPLVNTRGYIEDLKECSGGYVQYDLAETKVLDQFPKKKDGFRYTDESFLEAFRAKKGWHEPDAIDYHAILSEFDIPDRVERREIDEV